MFNNRFNAIFNEQCEEGIEKSENESSDSLFNNALEQLKKVSDINIREAIGMGATDSKDNSSESAIKKKVPSEFLRRQSNRNTGGLPTTTKKKNQKKKTEETQSDPDYVPEEEKEERKKKTG